MTAANPNFPTRTDQSFSSGAVYGTLAALIWGAWPVVSRLGVEQTLTPFDIAALRFGVAGIVLLPLLMRRGTGGASWLGITLLAGGAGVPYVLIMVGGLTMAPAGHAGVLTPSCMLVFSTLGSWLFLGDRLNRGRACGLAVIIGGVVMIGWQGLSNGGADTWTGDLMFVGGGLLWACYTVTSRTFSFDPIHATALVSVISMVLYLPAYLILGTPNLAAAPITEVGLHAVFQGLFAGILALFFYTRSVIILGAARGAVFAALVPGVAMLLAFPVLSEVPSPLELVGVVTVTVGMFYALGLGQPASVSR